MDSNPNQIPPARIIQELDTSKVSTQSQEMTQKNPALPPALVGVTPSLPIGIGTEPSLPKTNTLHSEKPTNTLHPEKPALGSSHGNIQKQIPSSMQQTFLPGTLVQSSTPQTSASIVPGTLMSSSPSTHIPTHSLSHIPTQTPIVSIPMKLPPPSLPSFPSKPPLPSTAPSSSSATSDVHFPLANIPQESQIKAGQTSALTSLSSQQQSHASQVPQTLLSQTQPSKSLPPYPAHQQSQLQLPQHSLPQPQQSLLPLPQQSQFPHPQIPQSQPQQPPLSHQPLQHLQAQQPHQSSQQSQPQNIPSQHGATTPSQLQTTQTSPPSQNNAQQPLAPIQLTPIHLNPTQPLQNQTSHTPQSQNLTQQPPIQLTPIHLNPPQPTTSPLTHFGSHLPRPLPQQAPIQPTQVTSLPSYNTIYSQTQQHQSTRPEQLPQQMLQQRQQSPAPAPPSQPNDPKNASPPAALSQPTREIKFATAMEFLDQVKLQYAKQPRVYNQFLDIMRNFKSQIIDTPGVISRVSELFKGHKHLILGFNSFLPPGYKIEFSEEDQVSPTSHSPGPSTPSPFMPTGGKQTGFDNARSYVRKIKNRFQMQPSVYKSFLDVLQAYHRGLHTIKDVYDQVATLFAGHTDLLEEFTQFLPDTVANTIPQQVTKPTRGKKSTRSGGPPPSPPEKERHHKKRHISSEDAPSKRTSHDRAEKRSRGSHREEESHPTGDSFEELEFFHRVKAALNNTKLYHEFLKCLNLYSQEIISRAELMLLVRDLLTRNSDLLEWFKHFIGFDEEAMELLYAYDSAEEIDNQPSVSSIDYRKLKTLGPSYRALPAKHRTPRCSGRTRLCRSNLNDKWVSVPTGSEDLTFKHLRKNQYEEILFKCEDERYELDMLVELNSSTIRALEPLKQKLADLSEEEANNFKLDPLDPIHARSIEKIYGDVEILEGLYANPTVAVPIILQRLKNKQSEWLKCKQEWEKVWKEIIAKNYSRSLDCQSFFFKQSEKKALNPKVLLAEIKEHYTERMRKSSKRNQKNKERPNWHLEYVISDSQVCQDVVELLVFAADKLLPRSDKEKIDMFLKHFLNVFLQVDNSRNVSDVAPPTPSNVGSAELNSTPLSAPPETNDNKPEEKVNEPVTAETNESAKEISKNEPDVQVQRDRQIFFGNENFYIFFRLYQIMYERLAKGKVLAQRVENTKERKREIETTENENENDKEETTNKKKPKEKKEREKAKEKASEKKAEEEQDKDRYQAYLGKLYAVIAGFTDADRYEDDCRSLLGIHSYVLYTMDKLVGQVTRQLHTMMSNEACAMLLSLFRYESLRPQGMNEPVYKSSCAELLAEKGMFLFEFEQAPKFGRFTIEMMDTANFIVPKLSDLNVEPSKYTDYVTSFQKEASINDTKKHNLFLDRNIRANKDKPNAKNVININQLECRICLSSFRLFFVENTEDFFYRFSSRKNTKQRKRTLERLIALNSDKPSILKTAPATA